MKKNTVFIVRFEVKVVIGVIIIVDGFDVFGYFSAGRLKTNQSVLTEFFQFHHKAFALVIDKFKKRGSYRIFVVDFDVFGFNWFGDILFGSFHWRRKLLFLDF